MLRDNKKSILAVLCVVFAFAILGAFTATTSTLGVSKSSARAVVYADGAQNVCIEKKKGWFSTETIYYSTLKEAFQNYSGAVDKQVRIIGDIAITEDFTVPSDAILLISYKSDDKTGEGSGNLLGYPDGGTNARVSWNDGVNPFATVTINSGVTLTVNGSLIIGGVQHKKDHSAQGHTSGDYSKIVNNGSIVVNGNIIARGLVTGSGTVTVNNGATLTQPFMINDFAGGTNTKELYQTGKQFPFKQFSTVNVQCKQIINYGAVVKGSGSIYAGSIITTQDFVLIGTSDNVLIKLHDKSRLEITYDDNKKINQQHGNIHLGDSGVCTISVYGKISAGKIKITSPAGKI